MKRLCNASIQFVWEVLTGVLADLWLKARFLAAFFALVFVFRLLGAPDMYRGSLLAIPTLFFFLLVFEYCRWKSGDARAELPTKWLADTVMVLVPFCIVVYEFSMSTSPPPKPEASSPSVYDSPPQTPEQREARQRGTEILGEIMKRRAAGDDKPANFPSLRKPVERDPKPEPEEPEAKYEPRP